MDDKRWHKAAPYMDKAKGGCPLMDDSMDN